MINLQIGQLVIEKRERYWHAFDDVKTAVLSDIMNAMQFGQQSYEP
ncbi:hypothetical protein [Xanthomonas vasicola]|nr:hypothetical protein [Xanthomonas vasicola]MBV7306411.1 hypothetical protein [Xanthomonas vasicola pv. vasculorum]